MDRKEGSSSIDPQYIFGLKQRCSGGRCKVIFGLNTEVLRWEVQGWTGKRVVSSTDRVGRRIHPPYMTAYLQVSLPKIPYMHRMYGVLANSKFDHQCMLSFKGGNRGV